MVTHGARRLDSRGEGLASGVIRLGVRGEGGATVALDFAVPGTSGWFVSDASRSEAMCLPARGWFLGLGLDDVFARVTRFDV